jgi:hypothetical protein
MTGEYLARFLMIRLGGGHESRGRTTANGGDVMQRSITAAAVGVMIAILMTGCTGERTGPAGPTSDGSAGLERLQPNPPPLELVALDLGGAEFEFWPYTGHSFDETTVDPMNLVFVGQADPVAIRAALFALDGDRSAFGLPDAPPFNATWNDAIGDVQTTYAEDGGWTGCVIQLTLGDYAPLRFHLRLFGSTAGTGESTVTLGAAHFELLIPGTTDHQVLSWMVARDIVVADFMRSGLLDPALPLYPTGPINATPTYRDIPDFIYNGLPLELRGLIGGPLSDVDAPVPMPSDGNAIVLNLADRLTPEAGSVTDVVSIDFDQVIPKPFCMDDGFDWVYVTGPVAFERTTRISPSGEYTYDSRYRGTLTAIPVDITQSPPVPIGEPFEANVNGHQTGRTGDAQTIVSAVDRRIAPQDGGTEISTTWLNVGSRGTQSFRTLIHCLD